MAASGVTWTDESLFTGMREFPEKLYDALTKVAEYNAQEAQGTMRSNAPWADQTGNARQGLFATVVPSRQRIAIILGHSVPYGIWLEVRWSGRYAIVVPTLRLQGKQFMADCRKLMRRMR